ncbi:unnamed protein product [Pedinophyceae sp. YPF-701]|nr:unnamed protein product [Pedinophyceae sp. YPF-701]
MEGQLERSRLLNSEGLDGLPARASQLLQLGGTFFLSFGPLILGVGIAIVATVMYFPNFVHGGEQLEYTQVDPYELLNEPTYDPMVPMQRPPPMTDAAPDALNLDRSAGGFY